MAGRQAGGGQRPGRYMKRDSARRRCFARAQRVPADDLLRLEKRVREMTRWASAISPKTMAFLGEKFPWIALVVPCVARVRADPRALRE